MTRLRLRVETHALVESTNDLLLERARGGAPEGLTLRAEAQSAGRGQRGRSWSSPQGGLYTSILLRPQMPPERMAYLTLAVGVAVHDALEAHCPGAVGLKWPNDVLLRPKPMRGAKAAGILVESAADGARIQYAVVGVGVNLVDPLPDQPRGEPLARVGSPPAPAELLDTLGTTLGERLTTLEAGEVSALIDAWTARALGLGEPIELWSEGEIRIGTLLGLSPEGFLRVDVDGREEVCPHARARLHAERPWLTFPP